MNTKLARMAMTVVFLACLTLIQLGCAMANRNNTPALNWVERNMVPEHPVAKTAALPFTVTTGVVAFTADAFILHPATVIDDSARDTNDALWNVNWEKKYVSQVASLPWRTVLTPVYFTARFLGRSMFMIPKRGPVVPAVIDLPRYEEMIRNGKAGEAVTELNQYENNHRHQLAQDPALMARIQLLKLKAYEQAEEVRYEPWPFFGVYAGYVDADPEIAKEFYEILDRMEKSESPTKRSIAYSVTLNQKTPPPERIQRMLSDPNPVVRCGFINRVKIDDSTRPLIEKLASSDPDPMVRETARGHLNYANYATHAKQQ